MKTKKKQEEAKDRNHRLNEFAKYGDIAAVVASSMAVLLFFFATSAGSWVCAFILLALCCGASALYAASSEFRIGRAAGTLMVISVFVNLLLPFAARKWKWVLETNFPLNLLLNFSLLCLTGAIVALLRNNFGNLKYIEEHDNRSSFLLAIFLVGSAVFKVFSKSIEPVTGLADLCFVIAGVVIGAMFEKERSNRRHAKKAAKGDQ